MNKNKIAVINAECAARLFLYMMDLRNDKRLEHKARGTFKKNHNFEAYNARKAEERRAKIADMPSAGLTKWVETTPWPADLH